MGGHAVRSRQDGKETRVSRTAALPTVITRAACPFPCKASLPDKI